MKCQGVILVQYLSNTSPPFFYVLVLQEAAAQRFDQLFECGQHTEIGELDVSRMLAEEEVLQIWRGMPAFPFILGKSDGREVIHAMRLMP